MNQIEKIQQELSKRFLDVTITLDPPAKETGSWFLDVPRQGRSPVVLEWRPDRGFGVSTPGDDDYGEGADEIYPNAKAATARTIELVETGVSAVSPKRWAWPSCAQRQGLSQVELAERMGVKQSNLSLIESRGDVLVSTLDKMASAMGGHLQSS